MIHRINDMGLESLDPQWAGGRPRLITDEDEAFLVETATTRPVKLGLAFTRWSVRKLTDYLNDNEVRIVTIGRERVRQLLAVHGITFQRTKTWKESNDPDRDAKLDRIEHVIYEHPDRTFAFDEFGPLNIRPTQGSGWAPVGRPQRQPENFHKLHGVRQFHGCYSAGDDTLWGVVRHRKSADNTLEALRSIRAARPDGEPIYVILDNLSAHKGTKLGRWAKRNEVELCFTPTYSLSDIVGEPDRTALRAATRVRVEQLESFEPRRVDPPSSRLSAVAQHQRTRPSTPRSPTTRTTASPLRETTTMGTAKQGSRGPPNAQTFVVTALAAEWDELGFDLLWVPESPAGKDALTFATVLLGATRRIVLSTGIAIVWARDAVAMVSARRTIGGAYPGRFALGVGISHKSTAVARGHEYVKPLGTMRLSDSDERGSV